MNQIRPRLFILSTVDALRLSQVFLFGYFWRYFSLGSIVFVAPNDSCRSGRASRNDQPLRHRDARVQPFLQVHVATDDDAHGRSPFLWLVSPHSGHPFSALVTVSDYNARFRSIFDANRFVSRHRDGGKLNFCYARFSLSQITTLLSWMSRWREVSRNRPVFDFKLGATQITVHTVFWETWFSCATVDSCGNDTVHDATDLFNELEVNTVTDMPFDVVPVLHNMGHWRGGCQFEIKTRTTRRLYFLCGADIEMIAGLPGYCAQIRLSGKLNVPSQLPWSISLIFLSATKAFVKSSGGSLLTDSLFSFSLFLLEHARDGPSVCLSFNVSTRCRGARGHLFP